MKYVKYILILVALIGFFVPMIKVDAQAAPQGTCTYNYIVRGTVRNTPTEIETEAACRARPSPISWTTCMYTANNRSNSRLEAPSDTETRCKTRLGGTWTSISLNGTTPSTGGGAGGVTAPVNSTYQFLAPLPCEPSKDAGCDPTTKTLKTFDATSGLVAYLNLMIKIFIGLCAVLAVVMIVVGGMEYMTSELAHTKESGKERIEHALLGLIIALGAYALLFTINPDLLKSDIKPTSTNVTLPASQGDLIVNNKQPETIGSCSYKIENINFTINDSKELCDRLKGTWTANTSGGNSQPPETNSRPATGATTQGSWYFKPQSPSGMNIIAGPFTTQEECIQRETTDGYPIIKPCTQSNGTPNW